MVIRKYLLGFHMALKRKGKSIFMIKFTHHASVTLRSFFLSNRLQYYHAWWYVFNLPHHQKRLYTCRGIARPQILTQPPARSDQLANPYEQWIMNSQKCILVTTYLVSAAWLRSIASWSINKMPHHECVTLASNISMMMMYTAIIHQIIMHMMRFFLRLGNAV